MSKTAHDNGEDLTDWAGRIEQLGYARIASALPPQEMACVAQRISHAMATASADTGRLESRGTAYAARNVLDIFPEAGQLWQTPSLQSLLDRILGPNCGLVRVLLFDKPPGRTWSLGWHKDMTIAVADNSHSGSVFTNPTRKAGVPHVTAPPAIMGQMLTLRLHLDAATDGNGPLMVLPGSQYDAMVLSDPSQPGFEVPDLSLPKSVSVDAIENGREMLRIVDRHYRQKVELAEFAKMDVFQEQALRMILSPGVRNAFNLSQESEKTRDRYGRHRAGQSVLLARRLVEAGCRFVTAAGYKTNQWDTHGNNEKRLRDDLCPVLDQSLSALLEDLDQRGLLTSTVVIVAGEFGRTAVLNPSGGRDHWPDCWSLVLGGGGIQGGQVIGASDKDGAYVADRPICIGDLYATVYKAMGVDWRKSYQSPDDRPVYIANGTGDVPGTPIEGLV